MAEFDELVSKFRQEYDYALYLAHIEAWEESAKMIPSLDNILNATAGQTRCLDDTREIASERGNLILLALNSYIHSIPAAFMKNDYSAVEDYVARLKSYFEEARRFGYKVSEELKKQVEEMGEVHLTNSLKFMKNMAMIGHDREKNSEIQKIVARIKVYIDKNQFQEVEKAIEGLRPYAPDSIVAAYSGPGALINAYRMHNLNNKYVALQDSVSSLIPLLRQHYWAL